MVITHKFQELYESCSKVQALSLPTLKENLLRIRYEETDGIATVYSGSAPPLPFAASEIFQAPICKSRRLTSVSGDCKAVYEVTFDITGSNFSFKPGDTIGIIPHNNRNTVKFILEHLNLTSQGDLTYHLSCDTSQKGAKIPTHVPVKSTLRHVLENCVDIRSVVKKLFLLALSRHTKEENERKVLEYLCSKEGAAAYTTHILNKNICILDLFSMFKSCKPPIEVLLSHLPRLLPRPYSIVNSYLKNPNILKICFSVIDLENNRKGLTTSWLEKLILEESSIETKMENLTLEQSSKRVPIYLRKNISGFSMPDNVANPLILIGAGTGVSPFIGFLEERQHLRESYEGIALGKAWVFFGCRNPDLDFLYEEEFENFLDNAILTNLSTAFSRVGDDVKYVQDAILQHDQELVQWIHGGASIFICGDSKALAPEVRAAVQKCLITHSTEQALLSDMIAKKRYLVDIWS